MPDNSAATTQAVAHVTGSAIDAAAVAQLNKKQRQFAVDMWRMQNEYNTPQMQMQRFKDAGLNPHLIYGQGNSGNAGPVSTPELRAPQFGDAISGALPAGLAAINSIYDLDIKAAQTDNLEAQNRVIEQDAMLRAAQIDQVLTQTQRSKFDLDFESEVRSYSADARKEQARQLRTTTDIAINRDAREAALNSSNIQEASERMLTMRQQRDYTSQNIVESEARTSQIRQNIELAKKEGLLKDFDIEMRKEGMMPGDPLYARVAAKFLAGFLDKGVLDDAMIKESARKLRKSIWEFLTGW